MKYQISSSWTVASMILLVTGCQKEVHHVATDLFAAPFDKDHVNADSASVVSITAQLTEDEAEADVRDFHFIVASGRWVNLNGQTIGTGEQTIAASSTGLAIARWIPGRDTGEVSFSVWVGDEQYRIENKVMTHEALPDSVLLSSETLIYDSTNSLATVSAHLFKTIGYPSVGSSLSFRAWHIQAGAPQDVGNFTTTSLLHTTRDANYTIKLELNTLGLIQEDDTVYITALCGGSVQSDTLALIFNGP